MSTTRGAGILPSLLCFKKGQINKIAKEIVNDEYVDMEIITKSTQIDWVNQVDGIPSFTDKTIETFVLTKNKSTVVLGGLIKSEDTKTYSKIPLLGDLPLIGALFRSKSFKEGRSELVFFITPEIVDVAQNEQKTIFDQKTTNITKAKFGRQYNSSG